MESRLQKPSGLKKPSTIPKCILPTDRMKANTSGSKNMALNRFPLAENMSSFCSNLSSSTSNGRTSPDLLSRLKSARPKLRRSRSANDLREPPPMRALKRTDTTIAPIAAKSAKFSASNGLLNAASRATAQTRSNPKFGNVQTTANVAKKNVVVPRRIPAYDYKARFNDLQEKHKILKDKFDQTKEKLLTLDTLPEQYEESQAELYKYKEELKNTKTDVECLQRQNNSKNIKIDSLTKCLHETKEDLDKITEQYGALSKDHTVAMEELLILRERSAELTERADILAKELEECREQLFKANCERKDLHNAVMDLRGNIRVFCRVRPPLDCEDERPLCGWNYIDESTLEIHNLEMLASGAKNKVASHVFSFDQVFHSNSTQEDVFEMVSPLIQSALDGYNICIFAYGQTGSGKTYTMDGVSDSVGVIPRTVDLLFESIKNYKRLGWEYEIKSTFLEIYNEVLYDLLSNEPKDMEIRMTKNKSDIYVSNITEEVVTTAGRLRQLMQIAKMNRATASTVGNERSSRSHAVTRIELIGRHNEKNEISIGTINLVDLAGSESPKTSVRMNETKNINRSLSELTNVILALLQKQDHIPYRNSKLTHLLMPSLGGNSKTLMFINVAPFQDCFVESVKSLRFAASVNSCKMAKAKKNKFLNVSNSM